MYVHMYVLRNFYIRSQISLSSSAMVLVHFLILLSLLCFPIATHEISKRYLLFPRQEPTRHQFIAGIGIPADLEYESLTVGYVLKAMFFLPWNATTFRKNPFIPEYQRYLHTSKELQHKITRWSVYATIESVIDKYGYNGRDCLLQAICETSLLRFTKNITILGELLHILLTPSASFDSSNTNTFTYFDAEQAGKMGQCENFYCDFPIMKQISITF